jgi:predicted aspartyl protease
MYRRITTAIRNGVDPVHPLASLLLAAMVIAPGPAPSEIKPSESFSVPFELSNGHIFVSAFVNGQGPYRFGFDTGASGVGRADNRLVALLALPSAGETANSDGISTMTTSVVALASLKLGSIEKRNIEVPARDYNPNLKSGGMPMMGIISREFFADRLVTIDYPSRTITFRDASLRSGEAGVVSYSGSFVIPICFAAGCFDAKVDTGSSRSIVIPKELVAKVAASEPVEIGQGMRTNGAVTLYEMTLREPVRVGAVTAVGQEVLYTDPSDSVAVIGSDFLKDYVLTIDQRHHLLRIEMPQKR